MSIFDAEKLQFQCVGFRGGIAAQAGVEAVLAHELGVGALLDEGAVADGVTNCAAAIQAAVDAAAQAGGGRVMVPAGRFLSGSVMLRSHVELHLCSGAVLQSSLRPEDIRPFRHADADDARDGWNGGFFLGACGGQDITISGSGVIDGQGRRVFFDRNEDNGFGESP